MILCLDVGNSQIYGGVFAGEFIKLRFRYDTRQGITSDQIGIFLRSVLFHNKIELSAIEQIAICSVVPSMDYSLQAAAKKYFYLEPFVLQVKAEVGAGLKIKTENPVELGADMVSTAIAAMHYHPQKDIIVADLGTATTLSVITAAKEFLGVSILAGIQISAQALQNKTEKLPTVDIVKPESVIGKNTRQSIQSGLYYGHIGTIKEVVNRVIAEQFSDQQVKVIGTGGLATLFDQEEIFDEIMPDLVLDGLRIALMDSKFL